MIRFAAASLWFIRPLRFALCLLAAVAVSGGPGMAAAPQADDDEAPASVSHPVVEPTPPGAGASAGKTLNAALERLARDPRSASALIDAGNAALALGDNEAALGFFNRAGQVAPGNAMVKTAMAGARLRLDDPVEALHWYAEAEASGADPASFALDRGLAFDLVGDNTAAIAQYRNVLDHNPDHASHDEALRREAISLAIGGNRRAADLALLPLLQRQDRAAWRAHIFVLAIAGRGDDAVDVARATMPADMASAIGPYLRFMVQLTRAQQAAVAGLGRFPRAADIGRDDPAVAAYAAAHPRAPQVLAATPAPVSTSELAAAAADSYTKSTHGKRKKGHDAPPVQVAAAAANIEPDVALPPPPPPPAMALGHGGTDLAQASRAASLQASDAAPATSSLVPQPTVLSRLDLPPAPRHSTAAKAPVRVAVAPAPTPSTLTSPWGLSAGPPAVESHAVVEPVPAPTQTPPVASPPAASRSSRGKTVHASAASDQATPAKEASAHDKTARTEAKPAKASTAEDSDTTPRTGKDKAAKSKTGKAKAAKDDTTELALVPCKPTVPAKAHGKTRAKAKAAEERPAKGKTKGKQSHVTTTKSRRGGKKAEETTDDEKCAPAARGEKPDAPSGVSRDSDSDDARSTKTKGKGRDKGAGDKGAGDKAEDKAKPAEKGGRHARYASRIWVEVLTGADRDKMPGEWRALVRKAHALKKRKPYITPWHSNFRLLTGPFDSDAEAQDFIAELRKDGVSGFEWTSPAGQAVDSMALP